MRIRISKLLDTLSNIVGYVEDKVDNVKIVDFAIDLENKIYDKILNSPIARKSRVNIAAETLYTNIQVRKDVDSNIEIPLERIYQSDLVRSGNYFNLGEIVSAIKEEQQDGEVQKKGILLEYTWMERASIDGKRVKENPEIIGKKNCREVPKEQYRSIVEKYYSKEDLDTLFTP